MSYEIKFKDRTTPSITVDNDRGEKLKAEWFDTAKHKLPVDIDGNGYLLGDIKSIFQVASPARALPDFDQPTLPSGPKCKGQYSIQAEINRIAQEEGGTRWGKLIQDMKWREKTRQKLRAQPGVLWCDYKEGECACD